MPSQPLGALVLSQLPWVADCVPALPELESWPGVVDEPVPPFEAGFGLEMAATGLEAAAATTG